MQKSIKLASILLSVLLFVSILASCSGQSNTVTTSAATTSAAATTAAITTAATTTAASTTGASTTAATTAAGSTTAVPNEKYPEHVDLSFVWTNWNNKSDEDAEVFAYIDEMFNCTFDWVNIASDVRGEKLGVMWASGDKFTASFGLEGNSNAQCMAVQFENNWTWPVNDFVEYYPTIEASTDPLCWAFTKMADGKFYGIPEQGCEVKTGLWVRQDWLSAVNCELPTTIAELETVMDAFRNQDPDGDGTQNTYGATVLFGNYQSYEHYLLSAFLPYGTSWQPASDNDSTLKPAFMHPNYKEYLTTMQNWFKAGYVHPDQIMMNYDTSIAAFVQGQVGLFFTWYGEGDSGVGNLLKAFPDSDPIFISSPSNDEGQGGSMAQKLYGGSIVFNKQATEAEVIRYLQMLDYFCTKEGNAVRNYGIPGVQWIDNGDTVKLPEGKQRYIRPTAVCPGAPTVRIGVL